MSPPGLNKRQKLTEDRCWDWVLRGLSETFWRLHELLEWLPVFPVPSSKTKCQDVCAPCQPKNGPQNCGQNLLFPDCLRGLLLCSPPSLINPVSLCSVAIAN